MEWKVGTYLKYDEKGNLNHSTGWYCTLQIIISLKKSVHIKDDKSMRSKLLFNFLCMHLSAPGRASSSSLTCFLASKCSLAQSTHCSETTDWLAYCLWYPFDFLYNLNQNHRCSKFYVKFCNICVSVFCTLGTYFSE